MFTAGCGRATPVLTLKNASDIGNGQMSIMYFIRDIDETNADLLVTYSDDGVTWKEATAGSGGDGTVGLATTQKGTIHTFIWDYSADIGPGLKEYVRLWLLPVDTEGDDRGKGAITNPLRFGAPIMYVANFDDGTVSVINTENFGGNSSVLSSIRIGDGPYRMLYVPLKKKLYVANLNGNSVSVIDTKTNMLRTTITVGNEPCALAMSPAQGRVFVVNRGDNTITGIETEPDVTFVTVPVGNSPSGIAVGKHNPINYAHEIFVTNYNDSTVEIITVDPNGVLHPGPTPLPVGLNPQGIAVSPNGVYLWVVCTGDNEVQIYETANLHTGGSTTIQVDQEPRDIVFPRSGRYAYVNNFGSGTVVKMDAKTFQTVGFFGANSAPASIAISTAGDRIYVSNYNDKMVTGIDPDTGATAGTVTVGSSPIGLVILPGAVDQ